MKIGKKQNWKNWTLGKLIFGETRIGKNRNYEKCKYEKIEI